MVAGGLGNTASDFESAVGGGIFNTASGADATVAGGIENLASGFASFAAGQYARAQHDNSFVWSDGATTYSSDRTNQFKIQASGGVIMDVSGSSGLNPAALRINSTSGNGVGIFVAQTSSDATAVFTAGGTGIIIKGFGSGGEVFDVYNNGDVSGHSFNSTSDRNAKEHLAPVSPAEILDKVAALPVSQWNYTNDAGATHIGPMAQDFHAAFGVNGADDKHISLVDEGGVALAAIQGLNLRLTEELKRRDTENAELRQRLEALERTIRSQK